MLSSFNIVAYCSGVVVALETIKLLCSENRSGFVVLIDGSIEFAKFFNNIPFGNTPELNNIQNKIITDVTRTFYPSMMVKEVILRGSDCSNLSKDIQTMKIFNKYIFTAGTRTERTC